MQITILERGNRFELLSDSGNTYNVRFTGRGGDENVSLWECDCPAGRHGRECKHLREVYLIAAYYNNYESLGDISAWTGHSVTELANDRGLSI